MTQTPAPTPSRPLLRSAVTSPILTRLVREMSGPALRGGITKAQNLKADHVALLWVLAVLHSGHVFECQADWLPADAVGELAGCSADTARRKLNTLTRLGYVARTRHGRSYSYRLDI